MKKSILGVVAVAAALSTWMAVKLPPSSEKVSALVLSNIEALTNPEGETEAPCTGQTCHRIVWSASCYRSYNGVWMYVCTVVKQVSEYKRTSCVEVCNHYGVSSCPYGTVER
jgi:hypothetical protein